MKPSKSESPAHGQAGLDRTSLLGGSNGQSSTASSAVLQAGLWRNPRVKALGRFRQEPGGAPEAPGSHPSHAEQPESDENREIARLAKLSTIAYDRERKIVAKRLGVRPVILDKSVAAARPDDKTKQRQGRKLDFPELALREGPVSGTDLIGELEAVIKRYVILPKEASFIVALWVLHTYCFDAFICTPRLAITAPEKRCGKTTLLDVLGELVPRRLATGSITAAAMFRTIELARPVLLIDEADTFLGGREELRGILNHGHRRGGQTIRVVGDDFEPRAFNVHAPVAIAMIGRLPATLADRSIHIEMRRAAKGEKVASFRLGRTHELGELVCKAARWVADNAEAIKACVPETPDAIFNRAADNWDPLLAIAETIGPEVPDRARKAALAACGVEVEQSLGTLLLADIRAVFEDMNVDKIASAELVNALVAMADRPWAECRHSQPMNQNWLAQRLGEYRIHAKKIRLPCEKPVQGYERTAFQDAFSRYLPETGLQSGTPEQ